MNTWGLVQWIMAVLTLVTLLLEARNHGKPRTGNENFWTGLISIMLMNTILYFGGFWG